MALLSTQQVAADLGVTPERARQLITKDWKGKGTKKVKNRWMVSDKTVQQYKEDHSTTNGSPTKVAKKTAVAEKVAASSKKRGRPVVSKQQKNMEASVRIALRLIEAEEVRAATVVLSDVLDN